MSRKAVYIAVLLLFILAGCQKEEEQYSEKQKQVQPVESITPPSAPTIHPATVDGTSFFSVGDWFDDSTVLIIEDKEKSSDIYLYNIFTGEKKIFFQSPHRIVSLTANPNYKYFLIQTTVSDQEAELIILNKRGEALDSFPVRSFDVQYAWNPYNQEELVITAFSEDWTFQSFLLNISANSFVPISLPQPFVQWLSEKEIAYMNIERGKTVEKASLHLYDLTSQKEKTIQEEVIAFSAFPKTLLTIKEKENLNGSYNFYESRSLQEIGSLSVPLLPDISGWVIPHQQFDAKAQVFYTFLPTETEFANGNAETFQLVSFSLKTGKKELLLDKTTNVPFKLSPNGEWSLMGYQFEKIFNHHTKEMVRLIRSL